MHLFGTWQFVKIIQNTCVRIVRYDDDDDESRTTIIFSRLRFSLNTILLLCNAHSIQTIHFVWHSVTCSIRISNLVKRNPYTLRNIYEYYHNIYIHSLCTAHTLSLSRVLRFAYVCHTYNSNLAILQISSFNL